jgi:hypothetical protein
MNCVAYIHFLKIAYLATFEECMQTPVTKNNFTDASCTQTLIIKVPLVRI